MLKLCFSKEQLGYIVAHLLQLVGDGLQACLLPEKMVSAESMAATVSASGRQCSSAAAMRVRATLGSTGNAAMRLPRSVMWPSLSMPPRMYSCLSASSRALFCR